ncbi:unnamed protein product [Phaeothamnion confervicola]
MPDIFRTVGNVTADLGAVLVLNEPGDEAELLDPASARA